MMSNSIDTIAQTREVASEILANSLEGIDSLSEKQVAGKVLVEVQNNKIIFPDGWYNPPPQGIGVLFDQKPFSRLKYDSLRNSSFWPSGSIYFGTETVGLVYFSPIDKNTGLIGDIGLTVYQGDDDEIRQHLRNSYEVIHKIAEHAKVGMKFSELCSFASSQFDGKFITTRWTTISSDPSQTINIGHTIPGSFEENLQMGNTYEEIKETIRTKRVHVIDGENFVIPETCAFTIESRLEDANNPSMPSAYYHFIVCFDKGRKTVLENFSGIFDAVGMDYMNLK